MDAINVVAYNVALAYAYGRFDCPQRLGAYVSAIAFADRAVADGVGIGDLTVLYDRMLDEQAMAGA